MTIPRALVVITAGVALVAAGCGSGDDDATPDRPPTRTVQIEMRDIAFSPDRVTVSRGDSVRFVFTNRGEAVHDAFIGDEDAQMEHESEMQDDGDMSHDDGHDGSGEGAITVAPGDTGELTHTFAEGDTLLIGCHQPGHYAAGMKLTIDVA